MRLTAIVAIQHPVQIWYVRGPLFALGVLVLLFPALLRTPAAWAGITLLAASWVIRYWPSADNHVFLLGYWTLAVTLALCTTHADKVLAASARWLVVAVFLWATLWKGILSPDYMDGRFFRVRLMTDHRFSQVVQLVGGVSAQQIETSRAYLQPPPYGMQTNVAPELIETPAYLRFSSFLTWATVLLEGAVALVFLLPWGRWTNAIRHGTLLTFCATAYAIAPVLGFGWLLLAMGVVQVPADQRRLRLAYVGVFVLLRLYTDIPWTRVLLAIQAGTSA